MRTIISFCSLALVFCTASSRGAEGARSIGATPASRQAVELTGQERNPFIKQQVAKVETIETEQSTTASEESRIQAVLSGLEVVGRTRNEAGWRVLLGTLILEPGKELPPVIPDQTQRLRVAEIFETMIEIEWILVDPNEPPKRFFIPVQLKPAVRSNVPGVGFTSDAPAVITRNPADPDAAQITN